MALTLGGTKRWPDHKALRQLGARAQLGPKETDQIISEIATGIAAQLPVMVAHIRSFGQENLAMRMATEWNDGLRRSLGAQPVAIPDIPEDPFKEGASMKYASPSI